MSQNQNQGNSGSTATDLVKNKYVSASTGAKIIFNGNKKDSIWRGEYVPHNLVNSVTTTTKKGKTVTKNYFKDSYIITTKTIKSSSSVISKVPFGSMSTDRISKMRTAAISDTAFNSLNKKDSGVVESIAQTKSLLGKGKGYNGINLMHLIRKSINIESSFNKNDKLDLLYEWFDRYYSIYPDYELTNLCHYVFITRPDLNILSNATSKNTKLTTQCKNTDLLYSHMLETYPWILRSLSKGMTTKHDFIPMLTSRVESLQLPDFTIKANSLNQPYTSFLLPYASHAIASQTGGTFDITFREYADLSIHKLFQVWLQYIDSVTRNILEPKKEYTQTRNKLVCDYMVSVYDIICAPDGKTILYCAKYTGCLPTSVANSTLSFNLHDRADNKISIPFNYFYCEVLSPDIFADFNKNAKISQGGKSSIPKSSAPILPKDGDKNTGNIFAAYGTGWSMVEKPFIVKNAKTNQYMLYWTPRTSSRL